MAGGLAQPIHHSGGHCFIWPLTVIANRISENSPKRLQAHASLSQESNPSLFSKPAFLTNRAASYMAMKRLRLAFDDCYDSNSPPGRAQRALERERMKQIMEKDSKRGLGDSEIGQVAKRGQRDDNEPPLKKVFPKRMVSGRSGNLFLRPNPMSFAARAWANLLVSDNGSSDDDKGPDTPEDSLSPPAIVTVELEEWEQGPLLIVTAPAILPTYKPSPFSFARRHWSSLSATSIYALFISPIQNSSDPLVAN
ncbi:hypothetical protein BT96DRAFT_996218 [Gymnopus androsaceus JB14]|uniref:Uncharacterized protein n=1 Tax=Gymnopus androsaceus JB14 TaxID=1447944 RepID=A0A6A4HGJ2_9AGAR|nr:hypothetical protein BT96DRAFT_996218 [Gymnopus androsaceus JB14]